MHKCKVPGFEKAKCDCIGECGFYKQKLMKQVQTFKFDPDLIEELKKESVNVNTPFNRYVENLLIMHPYRMSKKKKKVL